MVILKKIKGATLIETLTASVLIIIVFMIASLSFNNIFNTHVKRDQKAIENRVKELEYRVIHQKIVLPYSEDFAGWDVFITAQKEGARITYSKDEKEHQKIVY
ncbi:hypothetical protein M0D21_13260 [Aquimarina sp. D1M17]|uniref:hypothetical protein n=1 Tax=Aquimarina acroporae TaxID=2937283 RepID=UPI0020BF6C77|nr:hypothetical protein [Aquimarina acroporae]MCK8522546.1 hypothetical protein [Aquimarina acroporae]